MLSDRVVLITGANGALGRAVSGKIAASGARVALTGRKREPLDELASELTQELGLSGDRAMVQASDLGKSDEVRSLVEAVAGRWGGIDALVNLAGGWRGGKALADLSDEEWDSALEMNLRSAFLVNRAVLPFMVKKGWGRIVNISSRAAESPGPKQAAYNVAKAGVIALTGSIAAEYRKSGIAANVILPSIIDTPSNRSQMPDADASRWVHPQELASLIVYLLSDEGGSLNGAAIPVYGRV
jgi:NAD(P)-dependent dehydrogenase (short-subunit alcohol dehydrogenase family)